MNITERNSDKISEIREKFLVENPDSKKPLKLADFKGKLVIYVIENIKSHKLYVGKTTNLLNRCNTYIRYYRINQGEFLKENPYLTSSLRTIDKAIYNEGIENFVMYPIDIAKNRIELYVKEYQWCVKLKVIDPEFGYNECLPDANKLIRTIEDRNLMKNSIGRPHDISTKIMKSKYIIAINPDLKRVYASTGMKIFGDFVHTSKDQVKNCARRGIRHHGYYIVYVNKVDRAEIIDKRKSDYNKFVEWKKSNKPTYHNDKYLEYFTMVDMVDELVSSQSDEIFTKNGYSCHFIDYAINIYGYTIRNFSDFISLLKSE